MADADPSRRVACARHVNSEGSWEMARGEPAAHLAQHVRSYVGYHEYAVTPAPRRELPGPMIVVILDLGQPLTIVGADGRERSRFPGGFVAGLSAGPTTTELNGREQRGIQIDLNVASSRRLLGVPMHELAGQVVSLDDLLGRSGRELRARIEDSTDWHERFAMLDRFFAARVDSADPCDWLAWAWRRIEASGGQISIDTLARELGYSRKHVSTSFRERFGMAPKPLAQLVRFDRAARLLRSGKVRDLARIGQQCGYFDQAHFTREFQRFAGSTPGEFSVPWPLEAGSW
jgi:AraC-like DNA-binding protein